MKMSGEYHIDAPRQVVWDALNDPEVLRNSIPGCETVEKSGDNEFEATARVKVGPVSARFKGKVTLSDLDPPNSYRISGEGSGGAAGFAKGGADVRLKDADDGGTVLNYDVDATVGGKLAQVGQRLVDSTAKRMADQFFSNFREQVAGSAEPVAEEVAAVEAAAAASEPSPSQAGSVMGMQRWFAIGGVVLVAIILISLMLR